MFRKKRPIINVARVNKNAIVPTKLDENACFDIYACSDSNIVIKPNETKMIPTGLAFAMSDDYAIFLEERGSTGIKGMGLRAGIIDSGYRGEVFVVITNHNNRDIILCKSGTIDTTDAILYPLSKAITQAYVAPVPKVRLKEISKELLESIPSSRKKGALGSSGK
jgi:dUTP pyrophosphatase